MLFYLDNYKFIFTKDKIFAIIVVVLIDDQEVKGWIYVFKRNKNIRL